MWRDNKTGAVAIRHDQIRVLRPSISFPPLMTEEMIRDADFSPVTVTTPTFDPAIQRVDGDYTLVENNGTWEQQWNIVDLTPEEIAARSSGAKAEVWEQIKAERDRRKAAGVLVNGKWFQSDDPSRIQQLSLVVMGADIPPNMMWKTMDGSFVEVTQETARQIFNAMVALDQSLFANAEQHRMAMEADVNPAEYDFSTGWPQTFAEATTPA